MKPLPRSSGDLLADRRADYAEMLFANGEHAAAAELMMGAMELAPNWALGWFRVGEFHEAAGAVAEATQAWRMSLSLDPADRAGAGLKLAVTGAAPMPAAPPSDFVEALFDEYAPNFDEALVGKLGYRVPELLLAAIQKQPKRRYNLALDLGCGTGLMGERLRPHVQQLIGYDISAAMLKKAAAKNVYDGLEQVDLQKLGQVVLSPDLITAADVLMYVGALGRLFADVAAMLTQDGLFAFSVEALDGEGYALRDSRRYAHSEDYVRELLATHGFKLQSLTRETIRMDRNAPIEGLIVVAGR
jgi:predicted TPR repeat methyltransferase